MKIGCHAQTWGAVCGHPAGVGSLAQLTYLSLAPFDRAMKEIRLLGYEGVEAFDGDVLAWHAEGLDIRRTGLQLCGVYTAAQFIYDDAWPDERAKLQSVVFAAQEMGAAHLVVGGGAVRAQGIATGDPAKFAQRLEELNSLAGDKGLTAHFHPHPHPAGYSEEQTDEILSRCSIGLCPDLGVLAKGGVEPIGFVSRHSARISYLHLKDSRDGQDTEVGQGNVDMPGVMRTLAAKDFDGWLIAELDASDATPYASHTAIMDHISRTLLPSMKETQ